MPSTLRSQIESASLPVLRRLDALPRFVPFLGVLGFLGAGIVVRSLWPLMAVAVLFLTWLLYLSWPRLTTSERFMRTAVCLFFIAVTVTRAIPRG